MTRAIALLLCTLCTILCTLCTSITYAYDITATVEHSDYAATAGYKIYYGNTKGGPYPNFIPCGKPALKADGTFDCVGTGMTVQPIYAVAVTVDAQGVDGPKSAEYYYALPPTAPAIKQIIRKTTTAGADTPR